MLSLSCNSRGPARGVELQEIRVWVGLGWHELVWVGRGGWAVRCLVSLPSPGCR